MSRQHPYSPKCKCTRCKLVKKLVEGYKLPKHMSYTLAEINALK